MKIKALIVTAVLAISLVGCGSEEPVKGTSVQFQSSQSAAKLNCQANADDYAVVLGQGDRIIMDTDSTISRVALQGDGWCSGYFIEDGKPNLQSKVYCRSNKGGGCKAVKPSDDGTVNVNLDQTTPIAK